MDFAYSAKAQDYIARLHSFMEQEVYPAEKAYYQTFSHSPDHTKWQQPAIMETLKAKAKAAGLKPEQIAEGEEKLRRIQQMRDQLASEHPEVLRQ
mgnify:CR=1 FL=1